MTLSGQTNTYRTFDEVSDYDRKVIEMAQQYSAGEKHRMFRSHKQFWRKYVGMVYIIGNGTEEEPEHLFAVQVDTPSYIGEPNKIYLYND